MFKFNNLFNRAPDRKKTSGGNINKLGKFSEFIENQADFWYAFLDAKNQFVVLERAVDSNKSVDELRELNKTIKYLSFKDFLKDKKQTLSDNLEYKDDYTALITDHDKFIDQIKAFEFHSIEELKNFLGEIEDLFRVTQLED